jgi:hypothetical protein
MEAIISCGVVAQITLRYDRMSFVGMASPTMVTEPELFFDELRKRLAPLTPRRARMLILGH